MTHDEKVRRIAEAIRNHTDTRPIRFVKRSVSHEVPKPGMEGRDVPVDISDFNEILSIDTEHRTCTAEPGVTFSRLVIETLKVGLAPYVVPELKDITIGGAVAGCSVESMSYKVGGFHDTCMAYEIVDAHGNTLICTPDNTHADIFQMVHGTFGTVGMITKLMFKLCPVQPYVHLEYMSYPTLQTYTDAIREHYQNQDVDLLDGIIHSPGQFTLCIGTFVDAAPYTHHYDWIGIFYKSTRQRKEDYLRTYDYYFRYDAGAHWISRRYGLDNPILRFLLGKFLLPSTVMLRLGRMLAPILRKKKPDVIVDVFVPVSTLAKFWEFYLREFRFFPLWMVPYRISRMYPWVNRNHLRGITDELYIDMAIYGMPQDSRPDRYRVMEEELLQLPGMKTLISYNSLSKEEFCSMWDCEAWQRVKAQTDPNGIFGNLYERTHAKK